MADVLVAGGGPAGSALAILAGRAGISVDLFDCARFPRDKPCGEGLMPAGVAVLQRMGLAEVTGGQPFDGVRYQGFGISAEATFPSVHLPTVAGDTQMHGLGQRRTVLDAALLAAARATPRVRVFEGATVEGIVRRGTRAVGLMVDGARVKGALIVGADGARSTVRRSLGLDGTPAKRARMGLRMHFRLSPDRRPSRLVEVFVGAGHELYMTPLPHHEVLVAALADRGPTAADANSALRTWIESHPALSDFLRGSEAISSPRGRYPLGYNAQAGFAPGAVLLGDAAGFCDPITGGGMAQALQSAELLSSYLPRALSDGGDEWLWRFDRDRRAMLRDYKLVTRMVLALAARTTWARWTLGAMGASPRIMRHLVGVAAGLTPFVPFAAKPRWVRKLSRPDARPDVLSTP
jgi:2-polyprenyl-6-methoxyphenol hydroxylase-like FAD-dependent oxidoreductase